MGAVTKEAFAIEEFLLQESGKDLLRFSTAGSVDDGKSTLIGRLLYDTQSVYEDQVRAIEGKGTTAPGQIDFALLTDGLRAEREQGITIDVAYRYFSTARRKFIIADTPGHEQYTRNMATGASTADATVVLIDATKGVLTQSRRHAYIASLLGVPRLVVAVNKMDLAGYGEARFRAIEAGFAEVLGQIAADTGNAAEALFVPVSALAGDNVAHRSEAMAWYTGPSLLELLERLPPNQSPLHQAFRFPVQRVVRPDRTFRGFAGQIASGTVRAGDEIVAFPSLRHARVRRIVTWDGDLEQASAPLSVTLELDREIDISRGDLIAPVNHAPTVTHQARAALVWMDSTELKLGRRYLLKHGSHLTPVLVSSIAHRTDVATLARTPADTLAMNEIGTVTVDLLRAAALEPYAENRAGGAFILIDPTSNGTVAAGMVSAVAACTADDEGLYEEFRGPVTPAERAARWGHRGAVLSLSGPGRMIDAVERALFSTGAITARLPRTAPSEQVNALVEAGILVLASQAEQDAELVANVEGSETRCAADDAGPAVAAVLALLRKAEVLYETEGAGI